MHRKTKKLIALSLISALLLPVSGCSSKPAASSSADDQPVAGWGPERELFTMNSPADHVIFNSITDNPALGDERNFVRIREADTEDKFRDSVTVKAGHDYEVYIYFHNNAKSSLNESGKGIARGVKITSALTSWTVNSSRRVVVSAILKCANSDPKEIWDGAYITTDSEEDITLRYVLGSATIHNGFKANGEPLSDKYLFGTDGVYIGMNELDGLIPACAEYSGYITYLLRAE